VYFLGVDFGTQRDFTAIALLQREVVARVTLKGSLEETGVVYNLVYLERMELGTPYTQIVDHLKMIVSNGEIAGNVTTIADATGVGLPVIQMMRRAMIAPLIAVGIHSGQAVSEKTDGYSVPKRDLISALLIAIQGRKLRVAEDIDHRQELIHELQSFRMKQSRTGVDSYEALMEKDHDDLVLALSYAVWYPEKYMPFIGSLKGSVDQAYDLLQR
jgi:hypothetical protein